MDNSKVGERKLFLTPLVTFLEGPVAPGDINFAVDRMLSPLRRKYFSSKTAPRGRENGSASEMIENPMNICGTELGLAGGSAHNTESKEASSCELSFHLCITDDRGMSCQPIMKDTQIKPRPGGIVKVMLDWTDKEHESFDSSYLKDLPEVHKSGLTVKKTKSEAITLFSCLDAFLKEEPLGPDDMW